MLRAAPAVTGCIIRKPVAHDRELLFKIKITYMKNLKDLANAKSFKDIASPGNLKALLVIGLVKKLVVLAIIFVPQWLSAQNDQQLRRRSQFELLPVTSKDIVFVGNSITEGGLWSEIFNNARVKNRGIGGETTTDVLNRLYQVTDGKPKKVFLMIGINDFNSNPTNKDNAVQKNIRTIVERIQKESPKTKIYVQSILPVSKDRVDRDRELRKVNPDLEKMCEEKGVAYIDLYTTFADENGNLKKEYTFADGLHLNGAGYMAWAEIIRPYVK